MSRKDILTHQGKRGNLNDEKVNFPKINEAILAKWSPSGLEYIKRKAWKGLEGRY